MNQKVIRAVRDALEIVSRDGISAANQGGYVAGGLSDKSYMQVLVDAKTLLRAVVELPAEQWMALHARVYSGDMKWLQPVFLELVSLLWNQQDERLRGRAQKYGRGALEFMVRRWLAGYGTFVEFAEEFGCCSATGASFYRDVVARRLDDWLIAACGTLEPVCIPFFGECEEAA